MIGEEQDDDRKPVRIPTAEELREQWNEHFRREGMGHLCSDRRKHRAEVLARWMAKATMLAMFLMMVLWVVALVAGMVGLIRWGFGF